MALTFQEEIALRAAFMEVQHEQTRALREMFAGTSLQVKSWASDIKEAKAEAKKAKKLVESIPGVAVPDINGISLNVDLFKGIKLKDLINWSMPNVGIHWDMTLIPDIRLGSLPGFDIPKLKFKIKNIDLLPDISLRGLLIHISLRFPHLPLPSLVYDLGNLFDIDLPNLIPGFKLEFPEFFDINFDLEVDLPNLRLPDVNLPRVHMPELPAVDLSAIDIPGFDISSWMKVPGFPKVMKLLVELFDVADLPEIIIDLGGLDFLTDFISSALPFVQQVKSGGKAAKGWGNAAQELHRARKATQHREGLPKGDAQDACAAVRRLLLQSSAEYAAGAAVDTAQFGTSTAGLFLDLGAATGPAVAAAAGITKMCMKITIFGVKYKEMKKINALLKATPEQDLQSDIFKVCPLLGCYFLANSTTSTVINVLSKDILSDSWMANAEVNKKRHLDPLIKDCAKFIDKSRYRLHPVRQNKGAFVEKGKMARLKEGWILAAKKKLGWAPQDARVATHRNAMNR